MAELIGRIVADRYRVEAFLGKGGMAEVYKVWDSARSVYLAMKVLYSDLAEDKIFIRRFQREAETLAKLQHPNIVRFYGLERDGDLVYILMDYVEGTTLRKEIFRAKKPFSPQRVLEIMQPICAALNFAHQSGFVHCDVKPANIMLHVNGEILLTDFGISRLTEAVTVTMVGAGTPAYMAPEQARGEDPEPQTDIYALGVVLFEMLTGGERPFTGERADATGSTSEKIRWEQMQLPPLSLKQHNPAIDPDLEKIVFKCLEKNKSKRFASSAKLLSSLHRTLDVQPEKKGESRRESKPVASPIPAPEQRVPSSSVASPPERRKWAMPFLLTVGICVMVLLLVIGGRWLLFTQPSLRANTVPPTQLVLPLSTALPPSQTAIQSTEAVQPIKEPTNPSPPTHTPLPAEIKDDHGVPMRFIPAGEFTMGSDDSSNLSSRPAHTVYIDAFYIDKYEVTNEMYSACEKAGICRAPKNPGSITRHTYYSNPNFANYPVLYVDWWMANDYCVWRDARLPTEAEWEKAARGTDGRIYPWESQELDCFHANFAGCEGDTTAVNDYEQGQSPYGVYGMSGNVWEWTSSLFKPYPYNSTDGREDKAAAGKRIVRSGSWHTFGVPTGNDRIDTRYELDPHYFGAYVGVRCAKTAESE